jgi:hypothetical protein
LKISRKELNMESIGEILPRVMEEIKKIEKQVIEQ